MMATAVASPPAPVPKMPVSPECSPVMSAAFCAPVVLAKIESRGTATGATQAVSVDVARSYSACAIWRIVPPPRARPGEVVRGDRRRRTGRRSATGRRAGRTPARTESPASPPHRRRRDRPTDPLRQTRAPGVASASSSEQPRRLHPRQHGVGGAVQDGDDAVMRSPARPSPMARTIGIAPPTAASKRSWRPWRAASVSSAAPWRAITCLFAVTTDLPASSAARIQSAAGSTPPMASTTTSASLSRTSSMRVVQATPRGRQRAALAVGAAVEDVGELEVARAGGEAAGDGRTDGAETEKGDPDSGNAHESLHLPPQRAGQELAPEPRRKPSRGCRGVTGPVPQPLLIKKRYSVVLRTIPSGARSNANQRMRIRDR